MRLGDNWLTYLAIHIHSCQCQPTNTLHFILLDIRNFRFLQLINYWSYLASLEFEGAAKNSLARCGSRIWSRGEPQLPRPKVADVAEWSRASEASYLRPGSRARLRALEAFEFLVLKYAFFHILEPLFSFISDIYIKTKNLQLLSNKKWYAERSEAGKFLNSNCKK